jgi:hypothetical protein
MLVTNGSSRSRCPTKIRGVSGRAIYVYLHLIAARKAGAKRFYTLNLNDFLSFHRPGDPEILSP